MGEIISATFTPKQTDGGKARILRKRDNFRFRIPEEPIVDCRDDLVMDRADNPDMPVLGTHRQSAYFLATPYTEIVAPGYPSDSPYRAPDSDPA